MSSDIDLAIEILQATNDGDNLSPRQLAVVEAAVNGALNDYGRELFNEIHTTIKEIGKPPVEWLHDIEHMTRDQEGYVYYKGKQIEHFDYWNEESYVKLAEATVRLAKICAYYETNNIPITTTTVVWHREKYCPAEVLA